MREDFMEQINYSTLQKECTCGGGGAKSEAGGAGHPKSCPLGRLSIQPEEWEEQVPMELVLEREKKLAYLLNLRTMMF